ncbi:Imm26 family immunity protein [Paenibacillus sp. GCM10023250]|uniref:Imm26 family immunity protein n=1 Tax=Paenibacillus sp. GCM10023250 TaxID=3252648 RepID=UPI00360FF76D
MTQGDRRSVKLGDIYAIPLPDGNYAFGRTFLDSGLAIYKQISNRIDDIPAREEYQFIVGVYRSALKSGDWPVVGNRPFQDEEEAWPPPSCIVDRITGQYSIYHKGEITKSTYSECEGLEITAVWAAEQIIDRIMGVEKWHKNFRM